MTFRNWVSAVCVLPILTFPCVQAQAASSNPLFSASTFPYQAPRFDRIKDTDYEPAFERGMAEHKQDVARIANNPDKPTFDNTIVALEKSGRLLDRVQQTFFGVYQANSNPVLDKVERDEAPRLSQHSDEINLDPRLFARIKTLYDARDHLGLNAEQMQLLTIDYQQFVHSGALLSDGDKAKLRAINTTLAKLMSAFQQKLLAATRNGALVVDTKDALAGLDAGAIHAAALDAGPRKLPGKWVLSLQNTTQQPALARLSDRATRQTLFEQSWTRTEKGDANDTRTTIAQLARLRAQKAALFGYPSYAAYILYDQMAKTPEAAHAFMQQLVPAIAAEQKQEVALLQDAIRRDGQTFPLMPWDWPLYADQVRREKYALNQDDVKPYFEIHSVLTKGVFYAANQLYGLTFKPRSDLPVYHPDVMVYEVFDQDNTPLGLIYFDYYKRDNKSGGAWMSNFVGQSKLLGTKPVVYNVTNFVKAPPGEPQLITSDDVVTMFHEFGHALHGLFAAQTYPTLSGTNVVRDFVEFPSQFNENWAFDPKVLTHYAHHYKTGVAMPQGLVDKIREAARFNQGYALGEIVAASDLDMKWHSLPASSPLQDVDAFETQTLNRLGLDNQHVPPRYRSSYFLHIWSNGYDAGYYAYLWTEMLDQDAFAWFTQHGGLTRQNGQRFRDLILSRGHTMDYGPMFRAFYGRDPDIQPMLLHRGLVSDRHP